MKKRVIALCLSVVIFAITLYYLNGVFLMKRADGITNIQNYYAQEKDTVDVLILGSSHAGMNLDAAEFFSEYGISTYVLWGSAQPFWNTYYFLMEALKTQQPKVILLEVNGAMMEEPYSDESRQVTNTAGMHMNLNKVKAVMETAPKERWMDLLLGLPIYHSRYSELSEDDFRHFPWNRKQLVIEKGSMPQYGTGEFELMDVSGITEKEKLTEKTEHYFRMILDTCQQKDIPVILFKTPTIMRDTVQPYMNTVRHIAEEYGMEFFNFNEMDEETGFTADGYLPDGHLNMRGARLISNWLGRYLVENYELEDHRMDERYESWQTFSERTQREYRNAIEDPLEYLQEIKRCGYSILMLKDGLWGQMDTLTRFLEYTGIDPQIQIGEQDGLWMLSSDDLSLIQEQFIQEGDNEYTIHDESFSIELGDQVIICFNGEKVYETGQRGIVFLVFDEQEHTFVEAVNIYHYENFEKVNHNHG